MANHLQSLFVDSRFRTSSSQSGTEFTLVLPENIDCTSDAVVSVVAFSMPVTFWTVEPGLRDQLALLLTIDPLENYSDLVITLIPGQYDGYTFATMLEGRLNDAMGTDLPHWDVFYAPAENRHVIS